MPETTMENMPETTQEKSGERHITLRYRGRGSQIWIYLGKFLRMFVYQNDWKVLPMAAVIAGLVAMVTRFMFFRTMEGTLMSAFALTCVGIWNGCFNSIQVICRERDVVKREHRAGMHISSYIIAHLIYQALLCLMQTAVTVYVMRRVGIEFPENGLFTRWAVVDIGFTVFLVTYAADALSLWISSLARNTTTAMTIMPFVLIFQLVFSGGMLTLPEWSKPLTDMTISRYGLTALAAQADYNSRPLVSAWSSLISMRDSDISATVTVGQVLDYLADEENPGAAELRAVEFTQTMTSEQVLSLLRSDERTANVLRTVGDEVLLRAIGDGPVEIRFTLGEVVDGMADDPNMAGERARQITVSTTVGEIIESIGENDAHLAVQRTATAANYDETYAYSRDNVLSCWLTLVLITLASAALATVTLEFIDKDKR